MIRRDVKRSLQLFDSKVGVGENANLAGDAHRFHGQIFRSKLRMLDQGARRGQRKAAAGTDGAQTIIRLDDVAVAGKEKSGFSVRDDEQRLKVPQRAILAPLLGKLDGRFLQVTGVLLKLAFKTLEKRNRIGSRARKTRNDLVV